MITDNQTNTVYFSNLVPEDFPKQFHELCRIIESAGYQVRLLAETYDYYCRDYMPVQVSENDFVQFVFRPKAYFEPHQYAEITNPVLVGLMNNLYPPRYSPLILEKEWLRNFFCILTENNLLHIKLPCPMNEKQITADGL